jgi:hypothetical protein
LFEYTKKNNLFESALMTDFGINLHNLLNVNQVIHGRRKGHELADPYSREYLLRMTASYQNLQPSLPPSISNHQILPQKQYSIAQMSLPNPDNFTHYQ